MPASTVEITLTSTWQAVAGTGKAIVTPPQQGLFWAVGLSIASPPTIEGGHTLLPGAAPLERTQAASETLFLKGSGKAYVTRDAAPV